MKCINDIKVDMNPQTESKYYEQADSIFQRINQLRQKYEDYEDKIGMY